MGKFGHDNVAAWGTGQSTASTTYVALPDQLATFVTIMNNTGVDIHLRHSDTSESPLIIFANGGMSLPVTASLSEIEWKRAAGSGNVTISYFWGL